MPWEITIHRGDGTPLGDQAAVKRDITTAFPGVRFYREPGGSEKIEALKIHGVDLPDVLRQHFEQSPATEQGDFEGDDFSVRFFLGSDDEIATVDVEVRGDTKRAFPFLRRLAEATRWVVKESGNQEPFIV